MKCEGAGRTYLPNSAQGQGETYFKSYFNFYKALEYNQQTSHSGTSFTLSQSHFGQNKTLSLRI